MSRLLRLYPAAWRKRYGREFEALLRERPMGLRDSVDVGLGALDAHLHPELVGATRQPLTHRLPGSLALAAGVIWVGWFLQAYAIGLGGEWGDGIGYAVLLMFVAVPGDYLVGRGRRIGIGIAAFIGLVLLAWTIPWSFADGFLNLAAGVGAYLLLGAGLITLMAIRAGIGSRGRWLLLVATVLAPALVGIPMLGGFGLGDRGGLPAMVTTMLPFGFAWILFGLRMAIRGSATIHDAPSLPVVTEVPAT
jgi:hypothetical protein